MTGIPYFRDLKGNIVTAHDLPDPKGHWVANKKYIIVMAIKHGMISLEEAAKIYKASAEEIENWRLGFQKKGVQGLYTTRLMERTDIIPLIRTEK